MIRKWLAWGLGIAAALFLLFHMTKSDELAERLSGLYLALPSGLPGVDFERFLIALTALLALLAALAMAAAAALWSLLKARLAVIRQQGQGQAVAVQREIGHIKDQHRTQYDHLAALGATLTKRLDKRVLVHAMLEAASRLTSMPQGNTIVSFWGWHFETDTLRFDSGLYCDETLFAHTEVQATDPAFSRVMTSREPMTLPGWEQISALIRKEKAAQLTAAPAVILVPLVIEDNVLGVLLLFCHPDVLKSYEEQQPFYRAVWSELALALAIAVQGEVAILDRLTGVHNREYFMKRLVQEIERANRFRLPVSLLMVDIDNFKPVNDMLGHPQGDAVLKIIAKLIKKEVRAVDLVARYGGEEFIIMLPETGYGEEGASTAGSLLVAERIRKAVADEFDQMQKPLKLTISVGASVRRFPEHQQNDHRDLIRLADEQLLRAKTTGKNKVCVAAPEKPPVAAG